MVYKLYSAPTTLSKFTLIHEFSTPIDALAYLQSMSCFHKVFFILTRCNGTSEDCWIVDDIVIDALVKRGELLLKGFI